MEIIIPEINLIALTPQLILLISACLILLLSAFVKVNSKFFSTMAIISLILTVYMSYQLWGNDEGFGGYILLDDFSVFLNFIILTGAILTVLVSAAHGGKDGKGYGGEYFSIILFATVGMTLLASSTDLLTFFISLEILSVSLYVLIGYLRERAVSNEAALKYFLLGSFAAGFALYGIAMVYGAVGTTNYEGIIKNITGSQYSSRPLLLIGLGLLTVGLGFKISLVPFHSWAPDVYEGAPTPVTAFLSTGSKAAGFAALIRILTYVFSDLKIEWMPALSVLAILTMIVGNVVAIFQKDIKRMLAYSSIAHVGYVMVAIIAGGDLGNASVVFYLFVYTFMNLAAFGVVAIIERKNEFGISYEHCAGLSTSHPMLALVMSIAMFSLAGIPPTAGFVGKFYVFSAAVKEGYVGLALVGVLTSVISLYYYIRVVVYMYMRKPVTELIVEQVSPYGIVALTLSLVAIIYIGILPSGLMEVVQQVVFSLQ